MNGSWRVLPAAAETPGLPWLVLSGRERKAVLRGGSVLELTDRATRGLGPDILADPPDLAAMVARLRATDQRRELGEALLDQRLVAGIGNVWRAEALWETRLSPWLRLGETSDTELEAVLSTAAQMMRALAGRRASRAPRLPPSRPPVPPLRHADREPRPGRRQPNRLLVSRLPERRGERRAVRGRVAVRSPQLYEAVRRFCLGGFAYLYRESEEDAPLQFSFEEHEAPGRPALYEYRPRARSYVEARADRLRKLDDAQFAMEELRREPAAAIFAHAHAGPDSTEESALFRTILLPFLSGMADRCGGFEWDDQVFDRGYRELERQIFGESHGYGAVAPLVGLSCAVPLELGRKLRVRHGRSRRDRRVLARGATASCPRGSAASRSARA